MPGLVGIVSSIPRAEAERQLTAMVQALQHEPFYTSSKWCDESLGVYVGSVARAGSFGDGMPVCNESDEVVLAFAGEDYPDPSVRSDLKQRGHLLCASAASYLPHLYEDDQSGFFARLNGRFHGLMIDRNRRTSTLFNDRYGMGRLYWHESRDGFYFAAEAKALLAVCPELRRPNLDALAEYVSHGCVLENRTIFEGIEVLPPGSAWVFQPGQQPSRSTYFLPSQWEQQEILPPELYYEQLKQTFARVLPRYFEPPQKVAMSLTGGLDTRMIMAWHKAAPGDLPCFSFGGMYRDCQDVVLARRVAKKVGQPHHVIPVGSEFLQNFPHYVRRTIFLTDGTVEASHSPDLYVNERAAQIAPVRMTGNYGGEVMRRVRAFKPMPLASDIFVDSFQERLSRARATYQRQLSGHPLSFAVFKQAPWHHYGLQALEQTQLALRSPYLDNNFVKTVFQAPKAASTSDDVSLKLIEDGDPGLRWIRTDFGLAAEKGIVPAEWVRRFMTFTFRAEYAYDYGMPQAAAKIDHALNLLNLERLWLGRHKFYHFRVWYRDALGPYVQQTLLDRRALARPYVNRQAVEPMVRGHTKGDRNFTLEIHRLLTLELIHQLFFDAR